MHNIVDKSLRPFCINTELVREKNLLKIFHGRFISNNPSNAWKDNLLAA